MQKPLGYSYSFGYLGWIESCKGFMKFENEGAYLEYLKEMEDQNGRFVDENDCESSSE